MLVCVFGGVVAQAVLCSAQRNIEVLEGGGVVAGRGERGPSVVLGVTK